jgi:hypothetical protein
LSDDPLDQVNRFALAMGALVVMFLCLLAVLLAWAEPAGSIARLDDFAGFLADHNDRDGKLVLSLGAIVVVLVMLSIMVIELTPSPTQQLRVRNVASGGAVTTTKEIAAGIEQEVRTVPHIAGCAAVVAARGGKVEVVLDLHVDAGADLARTADEACRRAHELVEERMGIALVKRPRARMHYRELRLKQDAGPTDTPAPATGWERPYRDAPSSTGTHDDRGTTDTTEEAQA